MKITRAALLWLALGIPLAAGFMQRAGSPPPAGLAASNVTTKVVAAANAFLATLNEAERAKGTFAFNSSQRTGWSNLPTGVFQRNGLRLGE